MGKLNTDQSDFLRYSGEILEITILGGIKLEGLDRLRVTLKIEVSGIALRHNLDLYNDNQVEKLIRKVAEKLEVGTSVTAASLQDLTAQLENYRLEARESSSRQTQPSPMTNERRKAAEKYLKSKNLLERTQEDIGRSGVVGEEDNRLLMYLIFTSRKREQPLHVVSLGASGSGKTHLQEKVGALMPEEDRLSVTSLSENSFYYFGRQELQNKLILIEDLDGAESSLYPLRELQSKKRITKTVVHKNTKGETRSVHLCVEGPVSVGGCTTKESLYEDNANRSFLLYLDESAEQDEKIMAYQRQLSAGKINKEAEEQSQELLQDVQRLLQPINVVNPYAEHLQLPGAVLKPRRTNNHYLQFIEAVTFYHQWQRHRHKDPETGKEYITTTPEDIAAANALMKNVLLRKSDLLNGACRQYFEQVKKYLKDKGKESFTNLELRQALRLHPSNQKRYMRDLQQAGLVRKTKGDQKHGYSYQVSDLNDYKNLENGVSDVLDQMLEAVQSSSVVQKENEPLATAKDGQKGKSFTKTAKGQPPKK